ncbi:hypothetical protein KI387_043897 [Taxus chinensis]|uniref:Uncharacterized protein n=2 Tax=Taxus chinensis TaxID=29808 RepID=A0AA38FID6_TAXCH|nr:hypothetical protein KI387_039233 [Taxus chinensis]KAH9303535.1 hypothetical protein KI387_043897 [Taxus chinensis]
MWKACELTPMKKDLNELNSNSETHPIVPTCGEPLELVAINPEQERLLKVAVLKSGELMVFIHNFKDSCLYLYRCPKVGYNLNNTSCPIYTFRRGFDLLALDESTRYMALYGKERSKIVIYKFDESFRKVYWTGVERPPFKACISADGYFFIVFRQFQCSGNDVDEHLVGRRHSSPGVMLEIYVLGDNMSYLKTIHLNGQAGNLSDLDLLDMKFTSFGSQNQLLLYSPADALGVISSHVLKTALAREVVQLQQVSHNNARELEREETGIVGSCPYLGYIYHIFDKFATTPALFPDYKKCITFKVVLESSRSAPCYGEACIKYLEALIRQLKAGKDKDFTNMKIQFLTDNVENYLISVPAEEQTPVKMGMWVRKLVCLVPVQIARAENNAMVAL